MSWMLASLIKGVQGRLLQFIDIFFNKTKVMSMDNEGIWVINMQYRQ